VLLLGEPFSALDAAVRGRLQESGPPRELGLIVVYVTHRLDDAFALGHRLAVVQGKSKAIGPTEEVFHGPASAEVAEVMGVRNLFRACGAGDTYWRATGQVAFGWRRRPEELVRSRSSPTSSGNIKVLYQEAPVRRCRPTRSTE
jgi:molybdate transport system ATP-binding protein